MNTPRWIRTTTPSRSSEPGSGSVLRSFTGEELVEGTVNTYVAFGEVGAFGALRIDDTQDDADAGETKLSVANVSTAGALDVYITDSDTELDDTTPVLAGVGASLVSFSTDSGTFRLRVTAAATTATCAWTSALSSCRTAASAR